MALVGTRQLRAQDPVSVHVHCINGLTGPEGRKGANGVGGGICVGGGNGDGNGVTGGNGDGNEVTGRNRYVEDLGDGDRVRTGTVGEASKQTQDANGDVMEMGERTGVEIIGRTQYRSRDGNGDGNESSTGDGNRNGDWKGDGDGDRDCRRIILRTRSRNGIKGEGPGRRRRSIQAHEISQSL